MAELAVGQRLKSNACTTEVMVIATPGGDVDLTCGGAPMGDGGEGGAAVDPGFAEGTLLGKRYVNEDGGLEILCVKAGDGSLAVAGVALQVKEAKKLPKTD